MSLLNSASVWSNDDTSKKRTPSMRKTIKRPPTNLPGIGQPDSYLSQEEDYHELNTIENTQSDQETRSNRVNDLLNKITAVNPENAGNKLANFKPIVNPALTINRPDYQNDSLNNIQDGVILSPDEFSPDLARSNAPTNQQGNQYYTNNNNNNNNKPYGTIRNTHNGLGDSKEYGNYRQSYEPSATIINQSYYGKKGIGNGGEIDTRIMDKINYMIHMLEEQHNEKTSNITEEFILYTFLGIFIIFIVDSFSRAGKYIR